MAAVQQTHVFQVEKHANQFAYDWSVYVLNCLRLKRHLEADPASAAPYLQHDPQKPLEQLGFPVDTAEWTEGDWKWFEEIIRQSPMYYAYRYLPTEIQAHNIEYDASKYFEYAGVQDRAEEMFKEVWDEIFR